MAENDLNFKENVKLSFSKVKEAILSLENQIKYLKEIIELKNKEIEELNGKIDKFNENNDLKPILNDKNSDSIGNNGVCANMQAVMQSPVHIPKHKINIKSEIKDIFSRLTKREFLIFLTIYQLEDEKNLVTYNIIAHYLKISPGCVRTHITNLVRKGIPLTKTKINNRVAVLTIDSNLKALNLKQALINMYYQIDLSQTKLTNI